MYQRKKDQAQQWQVKEVLDEMIQIKSLEPDMKGNLSWQKCDTDKLMHDFSYRNQTRTIQQQEILLERQRQMQARNIQHPQRPDMEDDARHHPKQHHAHQANPDLGSEEFEESSEEDDST